MDPRLLAPLLDAHGKQIEIRRQRLQDVRLIAINGAEIVVQGLRRPSPRVDPERRQLESTEHDLALQHAA
jgi:hypothetical protein